MYNVPLNAINASCLLRYVFNPKWEAELEVPSRWKRFHLIEMNKEKSIKGGIHSSQIYSRIT